MPYFFSPSPLEAGATIAVAGEEAGHLLKARRVRPGERFALQDAQGRRFAAELLEAARGRATLRVLEPLPIPPLPALELHLLQAAVKDKAADWIVQKATELGVARVSFFPAANSTVARKQLAGPRTLARWERIAREACKQCDRQWPPPLTILPDLGSALTEGAAPPQARAAAAGGAAAWLLHPGAELPAAATLHPAGPTGEAVETTPRGGAPAAARVLVGPEGGFTEQEAQLAQDAGFTPVRLGALTLRAETAALSACALLLLGS